jgi:GTP-binding protein YchF
MSIKAGLVGLPNVGKSTLFNALTRSQVPAENYPFCTIEPHTAVTPVPDPRLEQLKIIYLSEKIIPSTATFVDIAGLVKGAASGEGLGNQFLSHIRQVDLILHVVRCFEDPEIIRSSANIDPVGDYEIIISELMLKDLETAVNCMPKIEKQIKTCSNAVEKGALQTDLDLLTKLRAALDKTDLIAAKAYGEQLNPTLSTLFLSIKNFLIIANIAENDIEQGENNPAVQTLIAKFGKERVIVVCAKIEQELSQLDHEEAAELMGMYGLQKPSLDLIIQKTYANLGLITFFTCGPKEIHAWPIKNGTKIRNAAGEIHSDLERGFICAEIFNCTDLFSTKSIAKLKETGKVRTEGQDYLVQDGDIVLVRFSK